MAYKLKCNDCGKVFLSDKRNGYCPINHQRDYRGTDLIEEVLDVAVAVAVGYASGSLIESTFDVAGDLLGSVFDW